MTTQFPLSMPAVSTETSDEERLRGLIEALSAYITHYHGGGVEMVSFDGERLCVHLSGACEGCNLAPVTLHGWVEGAVKQFFPAVKVVESV